MADLKACRILVTPTSYGKNDAALRSELEAAVGDVIYNQTGKPLTSEQLIDLLPGVDGFIAGLDAIDHAALAVANRLKVIARYGVGVDNVDLAAARERGIVVCNTPGANSASVAELTVGLILALARKITQAATATRSGEWPRYTGTSLEGKTIGLLGLGSIGRQVARRLAGFDCTVLAYDPAVGAVQAQALSVRLAERDEVVRSADFLSLHLPLLPETQGMVDSGFLALMKHGAYLINTSRGELVDEAALLEALADGTLAGAALDVFSKQPPDPGHPLLKLPQVIATPHMGAHTDGATNAMGWGALHECLAVLRGETPAHRVA